MTQETQQRIVAFISQLSTEMSSAWGHEPFSFEDVLGLLRAYGNKSLYEVLVGLCGKAFPDVSGEVLLTPEDIPLALAFFDTREEAEGLLLRLPEPDQLQLESILIEISTTFASLRRVMALLAQRLPSAPADRPGASGPAQKNENIENKMSGLSVEPARVTAAKTEMADRKPVGICMSETVRVQVQKARRKRRNDQEY